MTNPTAANVLVASPLSTGGVLTADYGTTLPTTPTASTAAFTATGYISEDGVTLTVDRSTQDVFAWGGQKVRNIQTDSSVQIALGFLETTPTVLSTVFGEDNVSTVGDVTTVSITGGVLPQFALVIDAADGDKRVRITAAAAQIISQEDLVFVHSAPTIYNVTIECFPDANGVNAKLLYEEDYDS